MNKKTETVDKDISEEGTIRQTNSSTLDGLSLKTINNLVEFIVIYVDSRLTTSDDCQSLLSDLQSIISDKINHFDNIKESLEFIESKDKTTMKIFVIMSGTLAENHSEKFAELSQVECIYIFCRYQEWSHNGDKIRGIYQDKTQLLIQLTRYINELANRWEFIEESSFQNESTDESRWYQLFIKILLSLPSTKEAQQDMVEESKSFYKGNEAMEKKIENFKNFYKDCSAIDYYTEDSFVYRIINYALRTQNFDIIIKFRFFIIDLHKQIKKIYFRYLCTIRDNPMLTTRVVYRGQYCRETELDHLKNICQRRNSYILLTMFGSASHDPAIALAFIDGTRAGYIGCLYEIIIPDGYYTTYGQHIAGHPFADLYKFGESRGEKELIFNIGTCFRLRSIDTLTTKPLSVIIVLELANNLTGFSFNLNGMNSKLSEQSDDTKNDLLELLRTHKNDMKEINWKKWWIQFEKRWRCRTTNDESFAVTMYECFDDPQSKLKAIELRKRILISDNSFISLPIQKHFHLVHDELKSIKSTRLVAIYELFLQPYIHNDLSSCNQNELIDIFYSVGDAYKELCINTNYALECYEQALQLEEEINPQSKKSNILQSRINDLRLLVPSQKVDYQTNKTSKDSFKSYFQKKDIIEYQYDSEQWSTYWKYEKMIRPIKIEEEAKRIYIRHLRDHLKEKEHWMDSCYSKIVFRIDDNLEEKGQLSVSDYRFHLRSALESYFDESIGNAADHILYLWRYEKFMAEWLSLNDVKRKTSMYPNAASLHLSINRIIEKLALFVTLYIVLLSIRRQEEPNHFIIDVEQFNSSKSASDKRPKSRFYDELDLLRKKTLRFSVMKYLLNYTFNFESNHDKL